MVGGNAIALEPGEPRWHHVRRAHNTAEDASALPPLRDTLSLARDADLQS